MIQAIQHPPYLATLFHEGTKEESLAVKIWGIVKTFFSEVIQAVLLCCLGPRTAQPRQAALTPDSRNIEANPPTETAVHPLRRVQAFLHLPKLQPEPTVEDQLEDEVPQPPLRRLGVVRAN